ncbi:hypothetical protein ACB098_04G018900 [Castanea mollissima]
MSSVFSKPWLQESLLTYSNKVGLSKSITLWLIILILYISSTTATILIALPQVNVDGNRVPVFFRDRPTYYQLCSALYCSLLYQAPYQLRTKNLIKSEMVQDY